MPRSWFIAVAVLVAGAVMPGCVAAAQPRTCAAQDGPAVALNGTALFIVDDPSTLNASDGLIVERLRALGLDVSLQNATDLTTPEADRFDVVIQSKTPDAATVGTKLKDSTTPMLTGEDNAQMLSQLAFIDDGGLDHTAWHHTTDALHLNDDAPAELTAGLSGLVLLYPAPDDVSFAPRDDDGSSRLAASAIRVAEYGGADSRLWSIYAFERGDELADGSRAKARRVFFGPLYDDTFRRFTPCGARLLDGALAWLLGSPANP